MVRARLKYPKLLLLLLTFVLAYFIFSNRDFATLHEALSSLGLLGVFASGLLFTYGFTAAPATAILLSIAGQQDLFIAGLVGGLGALVGDYVIFRFIRHSFSEEISRLSKEKAVHAASGLFPSWAKKYLVPVFAGLIIASPLPDELGVVMLATHTKISPWRFALVSFSLNTIGIYAILLAGLAI